jgi:hypothetical protein
MAPQSENNLRLEIGHVFFIDLVGYSKLLIEKEKEQLGQPADIVRRPRTCARLQTGNSLGPVEDGMELVSRNYSE